MLFQYICGDRGQTALQSNFHDHLKKLRDLDYKRKENQRMSKFGDFRDPSQESWIKFDSEVGREK